MTVIDDLGREYRSKMEAARVEDVAERTFWLTDPARIGHRMIDVTAEVHRFAERYVR